MPDLIPSVTVGTFPSGAEYSVQEFANSFAQRLTLTIPSGNVIFGQLGGTEPTSPLPGNGSTPGIWVGDDMIINQWNVSAAKYLPLPVTCGQLVGGVLKETQISCGAITASTILLTPDKSGTIALLGDIGTLLGTQTPTGTTPTIDWTLKEQVYILLTGNTTIAQTGQVDGQVMDFWTENNATSYTITWSGIVWPAATAPTATTAAAGHRKIDHYRLYQVGSTTYGQVLNNGTYTNALAAYDITSGSPGSDTTPPTVSSLSASTTTYTITIVFSELLQGGSLSTGGFVVKKNGVTVGLSSASASGKNVSLVVGTTFGSNVALTVQYSGSDIKDVAGNLAAAFGPTAAPIGSVGGGGGGGGGGGSGGGEHNGV